MDYELAPPLVSSTVASTMDRADEDDVPYELSAARMSRVRKRQAVAGIAASRSTLSAHSRSTSMTNDDWMSDDSLSNAMGDTTHSSAPPTTTGKSNARTRRRLSMHRHEASNTPGLKHTNRHSLVSHRPSLAKSEQRWINMLERNSEELMSQIQTLTSDANQIEKRLRAQLEAAENEIISLKEQLADREKTIRHVRDRNYGSEVHDRATKLESSRIRTHRKAQSSTEHESQILNKETELLRVRCRKQDAELLRLKKRNAELAEKILHHRGLEITVDGQQRCLLELSAALEETRRTSASEAASSPRNCSSPITSEAAAYSPLIAVSESRLNQRPISFDGTRWQQCSHLRNLSLPDIDLPRSGTTPAGLPLSPPLTEKDNSPLKEVYCQTNENENDSPQTSPAQDTETSRLTSGLARRRSNHKGALRPNLQRNESSLWAELHDHLDANDLTSRRDISDWTEKDPETDETIKPVRIQQPTNANIRHMRQRSRTFVAQMVRMKGDAMTNGLRVVLYGWVWLCFLCLLSVSVARVLSEGPAGIPGEPEARFSHDEEEASEHRRRTSRSLGNSGINGIWSSSSNDA